MTSVNFLSCIEPFSSPRKKRAKSRDIHCRTALAERCCDRPAIQPNAPYCRSVFPSHLLEVALPNPASVVTQDVLAVFRAHRQLNGFGEDFLLGPQARNTSRLPQ